MNQEIINRAYTLYCMSKEKPLLTLTGFEYMSLYGKCYEFNRDDKKS